MYLLKHRLLGPTLKVSDIVGLRMCGFNKFSGDTDVTVLR